LLEVEVEVVVSEEGVADILVLAKWPGAGKALFLIVPSTS
jgi:hypothetical protein